MGFAEKQTVGESRRAVSRASVFALGLYPTMGLNVPRLRRFGFAEKQTVGVSRRADSRASVFALGLYSIMGSSVPRLSAEWLSSKLSFASHEC